MTFQPAHDRLLARRQWQNDGEQADVRDEIERALVQYETADGFVEPCELVIAGATR